MDFFTEDAASDSLPEFEAMVFEIFILRLHYEEGQVDQSLVFGNEMENNKSKFLLYLLATSPFQASLHAHRKLYQQPRCLERPSS